MRLYSKQKGANDDEYFTVLVCLGEWVDCLLKMLPFDSLYLNIDAINSTKFENFFLTRSVLLFFWTKKTLYVGVNKIWACFFLEEQGAHRDIVKCPKYLVMGTIALVREWVLLFGLECRLFINSSARNGQCTGVIF